MLKTSHSNDLIRCEMNKQPKLDVVIRFTTSRTIPSDIREIKIDSYRIHSIPSVMHTTHISIPEEALLEFVDVWQKGQMASNPLTEARYILAFLSLLGRTITSFNSAKIDNANVTLQEKRVFKQFSGRLVLPSDFQDIYRSLFTLNNKLFIQYIRACSTYQNAISLLETRPTLGCFLLVVAVECLSNVIGKGKSGFEKFRNFISTYLPSEIQQDERDPRLFSELLKRIYVEYRSGFTHGGKKIPIAALTLAEKTGRNYIKLIEQGKEVKYPSLTWYENIVRGVLIEFLRKTGKGKVAVEDRSRLVEMAISEAVVTLRLKRPKRPGEIVFQSDVEIQ